MAAPGLDGGTDSSRCGQCLEVNDSSKSNVVTCLRCKGSCHTSCVHLGGIKSTNLRRVNWLCDHCAEEIRVTPKGKNDDIGKLKAELKELKDLVLTGFSEMSGVVKSFVEKSNNAVSVVVDEKMREVMASAVMSVKEDVITAVATCENGDDSGNIPWTEVVSRGKKRKNKNLIVIKASDEGSATDKKIQVSEALSNIQIKDSRFTPNGNIIMNFETEEIRESASEKLKTVENVRVTQIKRLKPKIMICNVHNEETKSTLLDTLIARNEYLQSINNVKDKMNVVFTKPAAGGTNHYIIRCEPEIRAIIHKNHDKVKLQWGVYEVRDRYHALMCYFCLRFGHKKGECSLNAKGEAAACYKCAEDHEGYTCHSTTRKCINCKRMKRNSDHSVTSTNCPVFGAELQRIANNTDHGFHE